LIGHEAEHYGPAVWAPDERSLAVEITGTTKLAIFVADLPAGVHSVSRVRGRDDDASAWAPDSQRIAVTCEFADGRREESVSPGALRF
jgi:hypothetical protein